LLHIAGMISYIHVSVYNKTKAVNKCRAVQKS